MKKILLSICFLLGLGTSLFAQYPLVTIADIQGRSGPDLAACNDTSALLGDTVRLRCVVMTHPDSAAFTTPGSRAQMWVRDTSGPWGGLDVIYFDDAALIGMDNLVPGDSVELTGEILEFSHESEISLLDGVQIQVFGTATQSLAADTVSVGALNDPTQVNQLPTGEEWEGQYICLKDLTVDNVTPFGGTRVSFIVRDAAGNKINVSDKFLAGRTQQNNPNGTFLTPNIGDTYKMICGILHHSPNGCTGANGRGYELSPFRANDYHPDNVAPSIISLTRSLVTPSSTQDVMVTAEVVAQNGVSTVDLSYGVNNGGYTQVAMVNNPPGSNTWEATIPMQADGAKVYYYACATDSSNNTSCLPTVPSGGDPKWYWVRDNGTTIFDVQFIPQDIINNNGSDQSGYKDLLVTVEGVVTASAEQGNLGYVFIQQEGELGWAGIQLTNNASLASLNIGDKVTVTGTVRENFGFTRIEDVSSLSVDGTGTITATDVDPGILSTYDISSNELYEGMLINIAEANGGNMFVVAANADAPGGNFAEWRVGTDQFDPNSGCRILTGRQTNSSNSSLNCSYVNDAMWATDDGTMNPNIPVCVVTDGMVFNGITGILQYSFGNMKLTPRNNNDFDTPDTCAGSVGIENQIAVGNMTVYPNPAQSQLNLDYKFNLPQQGAVAHLFDLMGREVQSASLQKTAGSAQLDLNRLQAGTYFLSVTSNNGGMLFNDKIIVAR